MIRKETAYVVSQEKEAEGIFSLKLHVTFAKDTKAGQFVSLFSADASRLLPRPVSVCEADPGEGTIRLVYRIAGEGTREFSELKAGDRISVMGPLGNGFPVEMAQGKRVLLVGGGIGIPPMLSAARAMLDPGKKDQPAQVTFAVGYRSDDTYLLEELKALAPVMVSTDDGSLGVRGNVVDAIRGEALTADLIFACGPLPMLRGVKALAEDMGVPCFISMEERMACGVGVCLGCVTKTTVTDEHSNVRNRRVCRDGPVFDAKEVDLS